jgi:hypothetical protein
MPRFKDVEWNLQTGPNYNSTATWEQAGIAVMMDVRDELKQLNRLLNCRNFLQIPWELYEIRKAVQRKKRKPAKKPATKKEGKKAARAK